MEWKELVVGGNGIIDNSVFLGRTRDSEFPDSIPGRRDTHYSWERYSLFSQIFLIHLGQFEYQISDSMQYCQNANF